MIDPIYDRDGITLYHADCRDVLPQLKGVDLVLTDPPYPKIYDHVWDAFREDIPNAMAANAFCVTLLGHYQLPRVVECCGQSMGFFWIAVTENHHGPIMHGFCVKATYKPVLVYRKGNAKPTRIWRDRFNVAAQIKKLATARSLHKWGQTETLFAEPVDAFCPADGVILDPFCGSGSVLRVAKDMGRRAIGIDIDRKCCDTTIERLRQGNLF